MSAADLLSVDEVRVPSHAIERVVKHLQRCGKQGLEGVAFWAGAIQEGRFAVTDALIPTQHAIVDMSSGVGVVIAGDELFRVNRWLYQRGLQLVAQIHSHPGSAYHSPTDDAMSVVARAGSLSIVIPDFAADGFNAAGIAVHRLSIEGRWHLLTAGEAGKLLHLEVS